MTRRTKLAAAAIGIVGAAVTVVWAAGPAPSATPNAPGCRVRQLVRQHIARFLGLRADLGITDEQRVQIRQTLAAHKKEIAQAALDVVTKRRALRSAVLAPTPDEQVIRAASDALGKAIGDAAVLGSKVIGELRPILTPEQIEKIKKCQADTAGATDSFLQGILAEP